jgi:hypothetical protein
MEYGRTLAENVIKAKEQAAEDEKNHRSR